MITLSRATRALCLTVLLAPFAAAPGLAQDESEAPDRRIIDVHLHALPTGAFPSQADAFVPYERPESSEAVMEQSIDQLRRFNVTTALTSGPRELLERYKRAAPDRIVRSLWVPI